MNGEQVDVEALQAQIDLSNSVAYDLVSSWMKPASFKEPVTSVSMSIARELEEHARRPPRLGLGASVSKASAATTREAAKLKGKLAGSKRAHGGGREETSTSLVVPSQEDDDTESRSTAISSGKCLGSGAGTSALALDKKGKGNLTMNPPRDDAEGEPVPSKEDGGPSKKRKKKHQGDGRPQLGEPPQVLPTPLKPNPFVMPRTLPSPTFGINPTPSPTRIAVPTDTPSSQKKKKKNKKKEVSQAEEEEWHGLSIDEQDVLYFVHSQDNNVQFPIAHPSTPPNRSFSPSKSSTLASTVDLTPPVQQAPSPLREEHLDLPQGQSSNILNLGSSPLRNAGIEYTDRMETGGSGSQKKRRARRRGKSKINPKRGGVGLA